MTPTATLQPRAPASVSVHSPLRMEGKWLSYAGTKDQSSNPTLSSRAYVRNGTGETPFPQSALEILRVNLVHQLLHKVSKEVCSSKPKVINNGHLCTCFHSVEIVPDDRAPSANSGFSFFYILLRTPAVLVVNESHGIQHDLL